MLLSYILLCTIVISLIIIFNSQYSFPNSNTADSGLNEDDDSTIDDNILKNSEYYTKYYVPAIERMNELYKFTFICENDPDPIKCMSKHERYRHPPKDSLHKEEIVNFPKTLEVRTPNNIKCYKHYSLLVAIPNRPTDFFVRCLYRKYYRSVKGKKLIFFVSSSQDENVNRDIMKESELYKDVVLFKELASYRSSSIQLYLMYKWINENSCYNFEYFVYHQSDVFFNFKVFFKEDFLSDKKSIIGVLYRNNPVVRIPQSPWYVSEEVYKEKYYPDHPSGTCFIVSRELVKKINTVIMDIKPKIWMDDVFMGFILKNLGESITDISSKATVVYPYYGTLTVDQAINSFIYVHIATPGQFILFNKKMNISV